MKALLACLFLLLVSCHGEGNKHVTLVKQWHLSPGKLTTDIKSSTQLPQYKHQQEIYRLLKKRVINKETNVIISEGCEGVIDKNFKSNHYGWSYKRLQEYKSNKELWPKILALMPLKLKVELGQNVQVICGDSDELLKEHALSFSDLRGFMGYFVRLIETKESRPKRYKLYATSLMEKVKDKGIDPLIYSQGKARMALKKVKALLRKRNKKVMSVILDNLDKKPTVVFGGLHIEDLSRRLRKRGIKVTIVTPKFYVDKDDEVLNSFSRILAEEIYSQ